jgi:transmembrane sensor
MEHGSNKYITYTAIDFVLDEKFVSWVQNPTASSDAYWTVQLAAANPTLQNAVDEARFAILNLKTTTKTAKQKDIEKIWKNLKVAHQNAFAPPKKMRTVYSLFPQWKAIAASIIIVIGTGSVFYFLNHKIITPVMPKMIAVKSDVKPGVTGAVLTLGNGSTIVLDSVSNGQLANQKNTAVIKKKGELVYTQGSKAQEVQNTLTTPRAHRYNLILADGTKVWLNAASSISFPTAFIGKERKVVITGEAYFEVAKDTKRPFRVFANDIEVKVLGTHFNINAYQDEDNIKTTLLEGSVQLSKKGKSVFLKPGEQGQVSNMGTLKIVSDININAIMAWKNGTFYFENASTQMVFKEISRWYDVTVIYDKGVPIRFFEGEIQRDLQLSVLLKTLEKSNDIHFEIEGKTIKVLH